MAAALLVVGALLAVGGTAILCWPAAIIVAGALLLAAGVDLTRTPLVEE